MALEAINEQLLRTVRVGVAVFSWETLELSFSNDAFDAVFDPETCGKHLPDIIPSLPSTAYARNGEEPQVVTEEIRLKKGRRTLVLTITLSPARVGGTPVLVLETHNNTRVRELETMIESYSSMVERNTREIQREKENVERLLLDIMPRAVYEEYSNLGAITPQKIENAAILVADFENFSKAVIDIPPASLVSELNEIYTSFDQIGHQLNCERIKATGGQYVAVVGLSEQVDNPLEVAASAAVRFVAYIKKRNQISENQWVIRAGISTGMVIGSAIGVQRYVYDVFGPAVDAAQAAQDLAGPFEVLAEKSALVLGDSSVVTQTPTNLEARAKGLIGVAKY